MVELLERMIRQNPWWEGKKIESIKSLKRRDLFDDILKYMNKKQIIAVIGLRRVGKTVLLFQLIDHLLSSVEPKRILYFSFDELLAREPNIIEDVLTTYENEVLKQELKDVYVFFDEINHIKDWQVILKRFYDLDKNIKFVVSGSASIEIKKAKESLAGRIFEFELKPLSFIEFLKLKGIELKDLKLQSLTIKKELSKYLMYGGFPELLNEDNFEVCKRYVNSIVEKIIFSDIPKIYDVGEPEILKGIFDIIAKSPGNIIEYKNIASALKISYQTVSKYISYLESAYLIRSLYNFRGSPLAAARKLKKYYLFNHALSLVALDSEADLISIMPKIVENVVICHLDAKYFWREYFDIDVLHNKLPIEIKYGGSFDIKNNINAVKKLKMKSLIVITKDVEKTESREGIFVKYIPLWKFLLHGI
jgi:predicted AAA+ superfamily ATPase